MRVRGRKDARQGAKDQFRRGPEAKAIWRQWVLDKWRDGYFLRSMGGAIEIETGRKGKGYGVEGQRFGSGDVQRTEPMPCVSFAPMYPFHRYGKPVCHPFPSPPCFPLLFSLPFLSPRALPFPLGTFTYEPTGGTGMPCTLSAFAPLLTFWPT